MKIFLVFWLSFAPVCECLQRYNWFSRIEEPQSWDGNNKIYPRNRILRPKPQLWRNLFGLKKKGRGVAALANGFKVQGTARLHNGKVNLDLTVQGTNKHLGDPSTTSVPIIPTTSAPGLPSAAASTNPTTGTSAASSSTGPPTTLGTSATTSTSATTIAPAGSVSTPPPSSPTTSTTFASPTTPAVTPGPTTGVDTGTILPGVGSTFAPPVTSIATSGPTTMATSAATTTLGTAPTSAPVSLPPIKAVTPTTVATGLTSAQPTSPIVTTAGTTIATPPVGRPSPPLPGVPSKPTCETPVNINIIIMAKEVLKAHNAYRRTHAAPELHLDGKMICDAQKFAQEIAYKGVLQHQSSDILARKGLGENIGMSCAPLRNGPLSYGKIVKMAKNVAKRWYDEVCQYNFDHPNAVPNTGHFTEIVWSGSRKLGVGYAVGTNGRFPGYKCVYVVGRYRPSGNIIGGQWLKMNVKRGSFNDAYCQRKSGIGRKPSNASVLVGVPWDKRNQLKYKESETGEEQSQKPGMPSHHHSKHHNYRHNSM